MDTNALVTVRDLRILDSAEALPERKLGVTAAAHSTAATQ